LWRCVDDRPRHEKPDIFCQLGSAPFEPSANVLAVSRYWDLVTFTVPDVTLQHFGRKVVVASDWPPKLIEKTDQVVFGGYPESRRIAAAGPNP
jgi:hypothetical protein